MILFLDDSPERHRIMGERHPGQVEHVWTVRQFEDVLRHASERFDAISLDHDLNDYKHRSKAHGRELTGVDACEFLVLPRWSLVLPEVINIHSVNPCGAQTMRGVLQRAGLVVRWIPFTE